MKRVLIGLTMALALVLGTLPAFAGGKGGKINLNKATAVQLQKIPGLNATLAKKIIQQRKENGEFVDMDELLDIKGMTPSILRNLGRYLYIEPVSNCNC